MKSNRKNSGGGPGRGEIPERDQDLAPAPIQTVRLSANENFDDRPHPLAAIAAINVWAASQREHKRNLAMVTAHQIKLAMRYPECVPLRQIIAQNVERLGSA